MHKAEWRGLWDSHRYDLHFLTRYVGRELDRPLDWQIVPLSAPLDQLMAAPILYVSGRGTPRWTAAEAQRIRQYVQAGGFLFVDALNGDGAFDRFFRGFVQQHLDPRGLQRLDAGHPLYTAYFELGPGERPVLEGVGGPCWLSVLYAPGGLSCPWDVAAHAHPNFKLGTNVVAYVTGLKPLRTKLEEAEWSATPPPPAERTRGAFVLGQVVHSGRWQPHKLAWRKVLGRFAERTGVDAYGAPVPVELGAPSVYAAHSLYLTGTEEPELNAAQLDALREYVARGGFVFVEAACGSERFDTGFRALARRLFPEQALEPVPPGHPLLGSGVPLGRVNYTEAVAPAYRGPGSPRLEMIERDGRAVLVYSPYDLSSAVEGHPCYTCPAVLEPSASELLLKVLLYGLAS